MIIKKNGMSEYWLSYFFSLLWERRGEGRGRARSARKGLKPQGQGQNPRQHAHNNKAKVKVVGKKNQRQPRSSHATARAQVTVKLPPSFGGGGGLRPRQPASQRAPAHNQTPPPRSMAKVSHVPARVHPKKKTFNFKKETTLGLHTHRLT